MEKEVVYKDLEKLYTQCMAQVIADMCESAWGKDAFATFKAHDQAHTKKHNEAVDEENKRIQAEWDRLSDEDKKKKSKPDLRSHIPAITHKIKKFDDFDIQACNKTLIYLEPIYSKIFKRYGVQGEKVAQVQSVATDMLTLRNKMAHLPPNVSTEEREQLEDAFVNHMNFLLSLKFGTSPDAAGIPRRQPFMDKYIKYLEQRTRCWYALSDFLDSEKYDYSRFVEVCSVNYIPTKIDNAKFYFSTSNLDETVRVLRNNLALEGDCVISRPTTVPPETPDAPVAVEPLKKDNKTAYIMLGAAGALLLSGILLAFVLRSALDRPSPNGDNAQNAGVTVSQSTSADAPASTTQAAASQSDTTVPTTTTTTAAPTPAGNQIPAEYQQKVEALKYASDLALLNSTLRIRVGGAQSPPAAMTWSNVKIYSEDPSVAVGEGVLVKGIAPGTTYVIVVSELGSTSAYRIIVE